ncbi:FecR family protein [Dyella sp.]|uniref:FecR family protein n=1 Tax=Dyella sp. TaxID=1869338 RepID=UPI002ED42631
MDDRFSHHQHPGSGSQDEAERWFVRLLEEDCPPRIREEFERWRAADPGNAQAYREVEYLWKQSGDAIKDAAVAAAARRALHHAPAEPSFLRRLRWWFPAAGLALAGILAVVAIPHFSAPVIPEGAHYVAMAGQQRTVQLSDGSSVLLNTDTEIVERYSDRTRRVDLVRGQAQFQVQGNKAWPFVVFAQHGTVTAVGTQFQVRINGDTTGVVLLKGKVDVATEAPDGPTRSVTLNAGQQVAFDRSGRIENVQPADTELAKGWTQGKLFAHDWRLVDLLAEMNRYSATQLSIGDASLQDLRISGAFRTGDQENLILALQSGWPIRAERVKPGQVVLRSSKRAL